MDAVRSRCYPSKRVMIDILSRSSLPNDVSYILLSMFPPIPEYLTVEILLRLPVISLLRFASVCREWHRIITSPSFKRDHFSRGSSFTSNIIHWSGLDYNLEGELSLGPDDEHRYDEVNLCSIFPDGTLEGYDIPHLAGLLYTMSGPCNGIFCVLCECYDYTTISLWNPATRWFKPLPSCPYIDLDICGNSIAFGVDPETGDMKVVLFNLQGKQRKFSIYNSRNNSWKRFEQDVLFDPDYYIQRNRNGRTFLNGVFYWVKVKRYTHETSILSFDMRTDLFQEIAMQQILKPRGEDGRLDLLDDTLALLIHPYTVPETESRIDIWLMGEKGCWTKHATIPLVYHVLGPFGIWKRNQIYACTFDGEVIIYDVDSGNSRSVRRLGFDTFCLHVRPYKESLMSE